MKIFFLIKSLESAGGTERVTTVIANELSREGNEVSIICLQKCVPFFKLCETVNVIPLNNKESINIYKTYLPTVWRLRQLLKREKPNCIIDVCSAMSLWSLPAKFALDIKLISWEHFNAHVNWNPITSPLARKLVSKFADHVVVLTETDREVYQNEYKAQRVTCIVNPITIEKKQTTTLSSKKVLAVGRLEDQKGFDLLLQTWKLCNCVNLGWKLEIIGSGSKESELKSMITSLNLHDSVTMREPVTDMVSEYLNASLYVLSSRFEGLPLVLIEAMSMGLPIVSFDCETGPRDIVKDGENGFLVPPMDIKALAEKIDFLVSSPNLLKSFSENAVRYSMRFDLAPVMEEWKLLLKDL